MTEPFRFSRSARQKKNLFLTGGAVTALILAVVVLQIHPVVAAVFAALLAPAVWDIIQNTHSGISVADGRLDWRMGTRGDSFDLHEVERVNTKLSLDFSQKANVLMKSGKRHRIPPPCLPPDGSLDDALRAQNVEVERSLF